MPIQGFTRFRKHQLGKQSVIGTPAAADRVFPFRGAITFDPHWTEPDVDAGSIDPLMAPYKMASDTAASLSGPLCYDDISRILAATVIGGTSPSGGPAYTHTFTAASLTSTALDMFTDEWGDDVTSDGVQAYGGVISRLQWGFGENLGPWDVTMDWVYAGMNRPVTPTGGLSVGSNPIWVYGRDTGIYINSTSGTIGSTKIADAVHSLQQTLTNSIDHKRYANGSNDGFAVVGWGVTKREITTDITFAKTTAVIAEVANWLANDPVDRYLEIRTTSPTLVGGVPYSNSIKLAGNWFTRSDGEQGGNSTIVLSLRGRYDAGLAYAFKDVVVNSKSSV